MALINPVHKPLFLIQILAKEKMIPTYLCRSIYLELVKAAVPATHIPSSSRYKLGVIMSKIWMLCIFLARSIFVD